MKKTIIASIVIASTSFTAFSSTENRVATLDSSLGYVVEGEHRVNDIDYAQWLLAKKRRLAITEMVADGSIISAVNIDGVVEQEFSIDPIDVGNPMEPVFGLPGVIPVSRDEMAKRQDERRTSRRSDRQREDLIDPIDPGFGIDPDQPTSPIVGGDALENGTHYFTARDGNEITVVVEDHVRTVHVDRGSLSKDVNYTYATLENFTVYKNNISGGVSVYTKAGNKVNFDGWTTLDNGMSLLITDDSKHVISITKRGQFELAKRDGDSFSLYGETWSVHGTKNDAAVYRNGELVNVTSFTRTEDSTTAYINTKYGKEMIIMGDKNYVTLYGELVRVHFDKKTGEYTVITKDGVEVNLDGWTTLKHQNLQMLVTPDSKHVVGIDRKGKTFELAVRDGQFSLYGETWSVHQDRESGERSFFKEGDFVTRETQRESRQELRGEFRGIRQENRMYDRQADRNLNMQQNKDGSVTITRSSADGEHVVKHFTQKQIQHITDDVKGDKGQANRAARQEARGKGEAQAIGKGRALANATATSRGEARANAASRQAARAN